MAVPSLEIRLLRGQPPFRRKSLLSLANYLEMTELTPHSSPQLGETEVLIPPEMEAAKRLPQMVAPDYASARSALEKMGLGQLRKDTTTRKSGRKPKGVVENAAP
jgi:hypothetical protein